MISNLYVNGARYLEKYPDVLNWWRQGFSSDSAAQFVEAPDPDQVAAYHFIAYGHTEGRESPFQTADGRIVDPINIGQLSSTAPAVTTAPKSNAVMLALALGGLYLLAQ